MKPKFSSEYGGMRCRVCLVREGEGESVKINNPKDIYDFVKDELVNADREMMISVSLNTDNHIIGVETVSIGTLNCTMTTPREVFKSAILSNANSIVLCHNHPSGNLSPSNEDQAITAIFADAGKLLNIRLVDHIIVSHKGYRSLLEEQGKLFGNSDVTAYKPA